MRNVSMEVRLPHRLQHDFHQLAQRAQRRRSPTGHTVITMTSFSTLGLDPRLLASLESMGYEVMTPVQQQSLPASDCSPDSIHKTSTPRHWYCALPGNWPTRWARRYAAWPALSLTSSCLPCAAACLTDHSLPPWSMAPILSWVRRDEF
jgi:hypothetical protein